MAKVKDFFRDLGAKVLSTVLTEKYVMGLFFRTAEYLAKKSTTDIDDKIVQELKEVYYGKDTQE